MGLVEKTLESPLDSKEIKPVSPKGNQPWIFTGRTAAEAEAPILWPPDAKSWLTGKDPDDGKDWRQEEKGTTEDEIDRMASLTQWTWAWASSGRWWWTGKPGVLQSGGYKESDMTERLYNRWADDTTLMAESEEELKSPLMKMKEETEKVGLKLNIQKMKTTASGPITSW